MTFLSTDIASAGWDFESLSEGIIDAIMFLR